MEVGNDIAGDDTINVSGLPAAISSLLRPLPKATIPEAWAAPPKIAVIGPRRVVIAEFISKTAANISVAETYQDAIADDRPHIIIIAVDGRHDNTDILGTNSVIDDISATISVIVAADVSTTSRHACNKYWLSLWEQSIFMSVFMINTAADIDFDDLSGKLRTLGDYKIWQVTNTCGRRNSEYFLIDWAACIEKITADGAAADRADQPVNNTAPIMLAGTPTLSKLANSIQLYHVYQQLRQNALPLNNNSIMLRFPLDVRLEIIRQHKYYYRAHLEFVAIHADYLSADEFFDIVVTFYDVASRAREWLTGAAIAAAVDYPSNLIYILSKTKWEPLVRSTYLSMGDLYDLSDEIATLISDESAAISGEEVRNIIPRMRFCYFGNIIPWWPAATDRQRSPYCARFHFIDSLAKLRRRRRQRSDL